MSPHPAAGAARRWILLPILLAAIVAAALLAYVSAEIIRDSNKQQLHPADAIVIFGAAEYSGRPSPIYRARLDHAFNLFQAGLAPLVITTGGAAADPHYSEGGVGRDYLMHRGVPDAGVIEETQGSDTSQSAARIGVIMRTNDLHSCIAVSDAYHVFRIRKMLEHQGFQVYVAPRPDSIPHGRIAREEAVLREALSYLLWKAGLMV
jgi:uncharacterized SAM-binding protein YcdF (DUF218 family)